MVVDLVPEIHSLLLIDLMDRDVQRTLKPRRPAHADHRQRIFGKARPAVTESRIQKLIADTSVGGHAPPYAADVRSIVFTELSDFVDEADLAGEHGIGGILDHLRGTNVEDNDGITLTDERHE